MILSICDSSSVLEVIRIIKILVRIITIVVPIILIVSSMIAFTKDVKDGNSPGLKAFAVRCIAAIIIIFIPTIVGVIANALEDSLEYKSCLNSATPEGINAARSKEVIKLIEATKNSLNKADYLLAEKEVNKLDDGQDKTNALNKLYELKELIDIKDDVAVGVKSGGEGDYKSLLERVNRLPDGALKTSLLNELKKMRERLDNKGINDVEKILKNISSEYRMVKKNLYVAKYNGFAYWIMFPDRVKNNLPIVVYLQGLGEQGNDYDNNTEVAIVGGPITEVVNGHKKWDAILIHPQVPGGSTNQRYSKPFNELIDRVVTEFKANKNKLSVMGFSNGCYGIFAMATDFPGKYAAAVPVECAPNTSASNFKKTAYWSFTGAGADGSKSKMPAFASQVAAVNGNRAKHTNTGHNDHNIIYGDYSIITKYDVVEWMISQSL